VSPIRSLVAEAHERRAKTLRLDESPRAPKQVECQDEKFARKAECIEIWKRCRKRFGVSMHQFITLWDHAYSTGHGYLDPAERRYPKPRSVRTCRGLENYLDAMASLDAEITAARVAKRSGAA